MAGVAVVTGAGRGIGRAIALALARDGWAIGILDLDGATAAAVAEEVGREGGRAIGVAADVTERETIAAAVGRVERELGVVDGLVNNAGWDVLAHFVEGPPELWDRVVAVNLKGVLHATYAVLPRMIERGR